METLIGLLVWVILFALVAYGILWVCDKFALPEPVRWICGAILLIILLYAISGRVGSFHLPR